MNRAERRKLEKKGITSKDIKRVQDNTKIAAVEQTTTAITSAVVLTLHDKWGWGNVRLTRLLDQITDTFEAMQQNYLSIEDMR